MQRVLIVDDEHLVADTLTLIFGKCGFEAKAAYSADEAMECAREFSPNLLLCDISMPGKDGVELVQEMSKEQPACRILVLTGFYSNLNRVSEESQKLAAASQRDDQALPAGRSSSRGQCAAGQRIIHSTPMPLGRLLILLGLALIVLGAIVLGLERLHLPLGRLPGDLSWRGKGWSVSFPLVTCLVLSVLLSLIVWIVNWLRR